MWPGLEVELAGRFVGQQEPRLVGEGAGDGDPLLLAARQLVGAVPGTLAQADELEQVLDAAVASARLGVHEPERDLDVLGGAQDRHEAERLEDVGDRPASEADEIGLAHRGHVGAVDDHPTGRGSVQPTEHVEQRRLAAARPALDRDQLAATDGQVDPAQGVDDRVAVPKSRSTPIASTIGPDGGRM